MSSEGFDLPGYGLRCGNCNAVLPTVYRTTRSDGMIVRERICDNCGQRSTTVERVICTHEPRRTFSSDRQ